MDAMVQPLRASSDVDAAPDWSVVPFAVACARCGHDLHGRSEPTCPGCALTFRWADAVPIEQLTCTSCGYHLYGLKEPRCPECATGFTWDEALASYHRQRKPLFEYHWRTKPVRSLFYTWWLALRPKKLWTVIDIHDPPNLRVLFGTSLVSIIFTVILLIIGFLIIETASTLIQYYTGSTWWRSRGVPLKDVLIENLTLIFTGLVGGYVSLIVAGYLVLWNLSLGVALHIFQQSMHQYMVRSAHVWRTTIYAGLFACVGIAVGELTPWFLYNLLPTRNQFLNLYVMLVAIALLFSCRSLALGYREYLRMDHSWGVATSAHLIALLLTLAAGVAIMPAGVGVTVLLVIGEAIGLFQ